MYARVTIATLTIDPRDGTAVLVLERPESGELFPLWISDEDARHIAETIASSPAKTSRGSALLSDVIASLGGRVSAARITGVAAHVVQAEIVVEQGDEERRFSARASDAIALAWRASAPILVDTALLELVAERVREASALVTTTTAGAEQSPQSPAERWNALLAHLSTTRRPRDASEV